MPFTKSSQPSKSPLLGLLNVLSTYQFDRSCHHSREVVSQRWQKSCAAKKSPQSGALEHRVPVSNVYIYIYIYIRTYDIYIYAIWYMTVLTHDHTLYVSIHYIYNGHDYNGIQWS